MTGLAKGGRIGEGVEAGVARSAVVQIPDGRPAGRERRVLCAGFRCISFASDFLRAIKRLSEEEHDARITATDTR